MPLFWGRPMSPDTLIGQKNNDTLKGKGENDVLIGRGANDRLFGGDDDDILVGDKGRDFLFGGEGEDRFRINNTRDRDVIRDFDPKDDVIDFSGLGVRNIKQLSFERLDAESALITFEDQELKVEGDFTMRQLKRSIDYANRKELDFESLEVPQGRIVRGDRLDDDRTYKGFTWDGFGVVDVPRANRIDNSGHVATSGRTAIYWKGGEDGLISDDEPFDFESAQVSGAWRNRLEVKVVGFLNNVRLGQQVFELGKAGEVEELKFKDNVFDLVDEVAISVSGGRSNPTTDFDGPQISIDDLVVFV